MAPRARSLDDAADAIELSARYGLAPDDWQEDVLEDWLGRQASGRWASATCGLAVPRQNGKNGVIEMRELFGMVFLGERFLHTAHEVKTARKAFLRIASFFENERQYPELARMVRDIRKTNGQEAVLLDNGGGVEFIARSKGSGRGFTVDVLVCDEAQDLTDEELAALLPTISAAPLGNPQVIYTGTPPDPDKVGTGEVFRRVRNNGQKRTDKHLAWTDFGVEDGPLPDIDSRENWKHWNPALGLRLAVAEVERERSLMSPEHFARERAGWWGEGDRANRTLPNWSALAADLPSPAIPTAVGIAADRDATWLSLGAALDGERPHLAIPDGKRVRIAERAHFVSEVARIQSEYGCSVGIDKGGPAAFLIGDLEAAGITLTLLGLDDFVVATADLVTAVENGEVEHDDDLDLNAAVIAAGWRMVGDRRVFARKSGDISALEAVAIALRCATTNATYDPMASIL